MQAGLNDLLVFNSKSDNIPPYSFVYSTIPSFTFPHFSETYLMGGRRHTIPADMPPLFLTVEGGKSGFHQ